MHQNQVADEQVELIVGGGDVLAVIDAEVYTVVLFSGDALCLSLAYIKNSDVLPGHVNAEVVPEMARPAQVASPPAPEVRGSRKDYSVPEPEARHFPAPLFFRIQS